MQLATPEVRAKRADAFARWLQGVSQPQPLGHAFVHTPAQPLNWTPLSKPLRDCSVALLSTAGVHLKTQEPFAVFAEQGDWTFRRIPADTNTADLTVTHTHYDTRDALRDINTVFPLDRLRELEADGVIGRIAPMHYGFMGFIPDPRQLARETAPEVAAELRRNAVDVALLTAG